MDRDDTGPPEGFVRVTSHVLVGEDGTWIVWEKDTTPAPDSSDVQAQWAEWVRKATRVNFSVDVPLPSTVTCKGKVHQ